MKHPLWYRAGMLVSLMLGLIVSGTLWYAFGSGSNRFAMLLLALAIAGVFWVLCRPIFFNASAVWRYGRDPKRREFKKAWRALACDANIQHNQTVDILWRRVSATRPASFYDWLRFEWFLDNMQTRITARQWLLNLVTAQNEGRLREEWEDRPDVSKLRDAVARVDRPLGGT